MGSQALVKFLLLGVLSAGFIAAIFYIKRIRSSYLSGSIKKSNFKIRVAIMALNASCLGGILIGALVLNFLGISADKGAQSMHHLVLASGVIVGTTFLLWVILYSIFSRATLPDS